MATQELTHDLTKKMISFAREFLQERKNYSVKLIQDKHGTEFLSAIFNIYNVKTLKVATQAVCKAEDELIRSVRPYAIVYHIGIVKDLQVSLLSGEYGLVWEIISPLTSASSAYDRVYATP